MTDKPMAASGSAIGSIGSATRHYPPEEPIILAQLVSLMVAAQTWHEMVSINDAISAVVWRAKSMRSERELETSHDPN